MTGRDRSLASVALPIPVRRPFTYRVDPDLHPALDTGARVRVPFGRRRIVGTIVEYPASPPGPEVRIRAIEAVLEDSPRPTDEILALTRFVSEYYLCSWGEAIEAALPRVAAGVREFRTVRRAEGASTESIAARATARRRVFERLPATGEAVPVSDLAVRDRRLLPPLERAGLVRVETVRDEPAVAPEAPIPDEPPALQPTAAQSAVLRTLEDALDRGSFAPFVLHGVTGSGKTEVYLRAAHRVLRSGGGVLYLVPEIGLTPLLMSRLRDRFGDAVEVLHSALPPRERARAWRRVDAGACRFVVGTRSAVFAPVRDLELIVVDEEHDGSYKQEETPRYNGRDLAVVRGRDAGAVVVLGSATPSLESYQHARAGRYGLLTLPDRIRDRPLPEVTIVDMRREYRDRSSAAPLSSELRAALESTVAARAQALVLRNRRGWAVSLFCPACGERVRCGQCAVTMTWHRGDGRLRCHACGATRRRPAACPRCRGDELRMIGEGSERIEDELRACLPGARVERMDRDTVRGRGAHERLLRRFERREIDVLVGTQMIAKGHDFPGVTLVGVLSADQSLGLPDFRAGERTFQLLTQVAGRAGRGEDPGRVILQAFDPEHAVLREAVHHDYEAFFAREIEYRRAMRYPPFTAVVKIVVSDPDAGQAAEWAGVVARAVREGAAGRMMVAGPGPAPVEKLRGRFRFQVLIRSAGRRRLVAAVAESLDALDGAVPRRAIQVDVDPYSLM